MVDWKLYIDSHQKRALDLCGGSLDRDSGRGDGYGYSSYDLAMGSGWGDGWGYCYGDAIGDGRGAGYGYTDGGGQGGSTNGGSNPQ